MSDHPYFERLIETAGLIARHPDYPGKSRVVEDCRWELEALVHSGRISPDQAEVLRAILLGRLVDPNLLRDGRSCQVGLDRSADGHAGW